MDGLKGDEPAAAVAANPVWYHTIELGSGVVTPGRVDLRRIAERVLPDDLAGCRALDVGTFDGFWAFEMERRGADVVAIDLGRIDAAEWPPLARPSHERQAREFGLELGLGFRLAAETLGSRARRVERSVYELGPGEIGGEVDFAFSGAILIHLRDPIRALERIADVLRAGGELRIMEPISPRLTIRSPRRPAARFEAAGGGVNWWVPNTAAVGAWLRAAGYREERRIGFFRPPSERRMRQLQAAYAARKPGG
jgi:SAM-dependent methyltransferase